MNKTSIVSIVILALAILALVIFAKAPSTDIVTPDTDVQNKVSMCYYKEGITDSGLKDMTWVHLDISGEIVNGQLEYMPAEKDSKVGSFEGRVGPVDKASMSRVADVIWSSMGEGISAKEQLIVVFGDGSAGIGFGEMVENEDGVFIYKDPSTISFLELSQIDCQNLDEKNQVEEYVRANIVDIAIEDPVLGGSWYVVWARIQPATSSGEVMYEDGHIQGSASFDYEIKNDSVIITNITKKD